MVDRTTTPQTTTPQTTTEDPHATDRALDAAADATRALRRAAPGQRGDWLDAAADALDAAADELIPLAQQESHLPLPRLAGELKRTTFQARLFAAGLRDGTLLEARIDHADPGWPMGPRPDIRRTVVPIGPVLVFAASNFPFAFSVFGGDSVSAMAAGCPVVVKAHPGHPELSRRTAAIVQDALRAAGAPDGSFGLIEGIDAGIAAVQDPRIRAVGFTGSVRGGRALFDLATRRPDPIPFYGELGSTNPVVVTPAGWRDRAPEIVDGFVGSFTLGTGQFCTKPGVLLLPDAGALVDRLPVVELGEMLNDGIRQGFDRSTAELAEHPGVAELWRGTPGPGDLAPRLYRIAATAAAADPDVLGLECFGPAALLVEYADTDQLRAVVDVLGGSLTASVQASSDADELAVELVDLLTENAGRVLWNQWPTGVTVSAAQQHGGPWPATTAPTTTSVGTAAIRRFQRPVAYQNVPAAALPAELRD